MQERPCRFCGAATPLRQSHILPAFVLRWLKETSPGAIRLAETVDRRTQDGVKIKLLCEVCEQTFSAWEKAFAERIFLPFHQRNADFEEIHYGSWALKFAASVSWRVLTFYHENSDISHFDEKQLQEAAIALEHWEKFLKGLILHPARFEQHLIPLDFVESISGVGIRWSPFINRYLTRTIDMDVVAFDHSAIVYSKLGRLLLVGFIAGEQRSCWKDTRIHVREGGFGGVKQYRVPSSLIHFINSKANKTAGTLASMSPKQNDIIQQAILKKAASGELFDTEIFEAIKRDAVLFGKEAFSVTSRDSSKDDGEDAGAPFLGSQAPRA